MLIADYNDFPAMIFIWFACITTVDFYIDIGLNSAVISSPHKFTDFTGTILDATQYKIYTTMCIKPRSFRAIYWGHFKNTQKD